MYEVTYGTKYAATKDMNRAQLAKLIREDIKAAVKAGTLPKAKYSVRKRDFAGGGAIDVTFSHVEEAGFVLFNMARIEHDMKNPNDYTNMPIYSERTREIMGKLDEMVGEYNFDGSESQVDYFHVRFYGGHSKPEWQWEHAVREGFKAAHKAAQEAPKAPPVSAQVEWMTALGAI